MADNNWKWGQSSQSAFGLVGQFFNFTPKNLVTTKDADAKKALKEADASDIQVKRVQDTVNATKRQWRNQAKIGAMIHGLVRSGMDLILQQRRQESTTTKQYAKLITDTSVLSAKTQTAVEKTYYKGEKQIRNAGVQLKLAKEELDSQYQTIESSQQQQSQQRRFGYRDRAQKRLEANSRPWRNY